MIHVEASSLNDRVLPGSFALHESLGALAQLVSQNPLLGLLEAPCSPEDSLVYLRRGVERFDTMRLQHTRTLERHKYDTSRLEAELKSQQTRLLETKNRALAAEVRCGKLETLVSALTQKLHTTSIELTETNEWLTLFEQKTQELFGPHAASESSAA